jgi:hypothetical protein
LERPRGLARVRETMAELIEQERHSRLTLTMPQRLWKNSRPSRR